VFLSEDKNTLAAMPQLIDEFLYENLDLRLNTRKTILQPVEKGLDHLGFFHKRGGVMIRRSAVRRAKQNLKKTVEKCYKTGDSESLCATLGSYLGYFRSADGYRLRQSLVAKVSNDPRWQDIISFDSESRKAKPLNIKNRCERLSKLDIVMQDEFLRDFEPPPWENGKPDRALNYLLSWQSVADFMEQADELCTQMH